MMFFGFFELAFTVIFALVIAAFVIVFLRGFKEWNNNNGSPRLDVEAGVVAKRTSTHSDPNMHHSTTYYVTFEVRSGDRMELRVTGREYGMIAEGDFGVLSFQGTRFLGFDRR